MADIESLMIRRKKILIEIACVTACSLEYIQLGTTYYDINDLENLKICLVFGVEFETSLRIIHFINHCNSTKEIDIEAVLKALYGYRR